MAVWRQLPMSPLGGFPSGSHGSTVLDASLGAETRRVRML